MNRFFYSVFWPVTSLRPGTACRALTVLCFLLIAHLVRAEEAVRPVESEIFAAILNDAARAPSVAGKSTVILGSTVEIDMLDGSIEEQLKRIGARIPEASASVVEDLVHVVGTRGRVVLVSRHLRPETSCVIMPNSIYDEIFAENSRTRAWEKFKAAYPNAAQGFVSFSRVGYDSTANQALVYVRFTCGPSGTCGAGYLLLFELKWGRWVKVNSELWVIS